MVDAAPPPEPQLPSSVSGIFADVIVPRHLNRSFTYRVPQRFHHQVRVGSLVQIPFGSSTVRGIVVSLSNSLPGAAERAGYAQAGLREILSLPGASERSQLDPDALDLVRFVSDYYLTPLGPEKFYATTGFPLKKAGTIPIYLTYLDSKKLGPLTALSEDLTMAARNALLEIIDYMVRTKGLTPEQAYIVSSVAVDLRIGQLVDVPNYIVSAILPLTIFDK